MNAIECRAVRKDYEHFELQDIDLTVPTGTVMGFVGPNGAGKSTTIRILMGLVHQDRGEVCVLGSAMPEEQLAAKWNIGYVSEDMRLHPTETLGFHLQLMASIFPKWDGPYADKLMQRFELQAAQKVKGLSHGQRVKAALLLAFARRPDLLLMDEPTTGLDPVARREVLAEMSAVMADESRTILFSSHNTLDVEQLSDQITFINKGEILFSEDKETLLDSWRRIRIQVSDQFTAPSLPAGTTIEVAGSLGVVTTNHYCEGLSTALTRAGAAIAAVEPLTLEEIFLTSIPAGGDAS